MRHLAAQRGSIPLVISVAKHIGINRMDNGGKTALHYSVESRRASATLESLSSSGAGVQIKVSQARSTLHDAVRMEEST